MTRHVSIRVPADVVQAVDAEARRLDRTRTWVIVRALRSALPAGAGEQNTQAFAAPAPTGAGERSSAAARASAAPDGTVKSRRGARAAGNERATGPYSGRGGEDDSAQPQA